MSNLKYPVKVEKLITTAPATMRGGILATPDSTAVTIVDFDEYFLVMECEGTTIPSGESGYKKGCIFIKTDAIDGELCRYMNIGSSILCNFVAQESQQLTGFSMYVDDATGNDNNPGTQLLPKKTFMAGLTAAASLNKGNCNLYLGDGTYNENINFPDFFNSDYASSGTLGTNIINIIGNILHPENVNIIGNTLVNQFTLSFRNLKCFYVLDGLTIQGSGSGVKSGMAIADSNVSWKNLNFVNVDQFFVGAGKCRINAFSTGNVRSWIRNTAIVTTGILLSTDAEFVDNANYNMSGGTGYFGLILTGAHWYRSGDSLNTFAQRKISMIADSTGGRGGILIQSGGVMTNFCQIYGENLTRETDKASTPATIMIGSGGTFLPSTTTITAKNSNSIMSTSPGAKFEETANETSFIALGTTPSRVVISPNTKNVCKRIGSRVLMPVYTNVVQLQEGGGLAIYDTNPDTVVVASAIQFGSHTNPINIGDTITGSLSGTTGIVESVGSTQILYKITAGTFVLNDIVTASSGGVTSALTNVVEHNLLTRYNYQNGQTLGFIYDQGGFTNSLNTFLINTVAASVITLDIGSNPVPHGYGPGSSPYIINGVSTNQVSKDSLIQYASDTDPFIAKDYGYSGALPLNTTAFFTHGGGLSSNAYPLYIPHVKELISDFEVQARVAPGGAATDTYTVMVNGVATPATVSLTADKKFGGIVLDTPIEIKCGYTGHIYEVGGGTGQTDLVNKGRYTNSIITSFSLIISATGTPDQFSWTQYNTSGGVVANAAGVAITGDWQLLADGVYIRFTNTTGHTNGTTWNWWNFPADTISIKAVTDPATASEDIVASFTTIRNTTI